MKKLFAVTAVLLLLSFAAFADTITVTGTNSTSGKPVNATATYWVSGNTLYINITNLQTNIGDVSQAVSGVFFQISGNSGAGSVTDSGSGYYQFFNGGGSAGSCANCGNWGLNTSFTLGSLTGYQFSALTGTGGPNYTILSNSVTSPNGSITQSDPHNPFFITSPAGGGCSYSSTTQINSCYVQVALTIPGLTSTTQISNFTLLFGTDNSTANVVPEPASMLLLGTGLVGLGGALRKKLRR